MAASILDDHFDDPGCSAFLQVTPRTLARYNAEGYGPPRIRVGRKNYYPKERVREWLATREIGDRGNNGKRRRGAAHSAL
jgi:hypothetical protein